MNKRELNEVLQRAVVPEREADYWEQFPRRVMAELARRRRETRTKSTVRGAWLWRAAFQTISAKTAFALGLAAVCATLGLVLGWWMGPRAPTNDPQLAAAQKYFREIQALFPHQLRAIVFDREGTHLVLAEEPNLPASPPLYLRICGPKGCQRFVTFSGQQIRVNGEMCDVLADGHGSVLLVGQQLLKAGSGAVARSGQYQIEARVLETPS